MRMDVLWHLAVVCYEGCEGFGTANGLPQPRTELAERSHEQLLMGPSILTVQLTVNSKYVSFPCFIFSPGL